jgi:adenylate kinase family enzyme
MIIGPSSSGKTLMVKKIAQRLKKSGISREVHVFSPSSDWGKSFIKHTDIEDLHFLSNDDRRLIIFDDFGQHIKSADGEIKKIFEDLLINSRSRNDRIILSMQPGEKKVYSPMIRKNCTCKIILKY